MGDPTGTSSHIATGSDTNRMHHDELEVLLAVYSSVTTEMNRRHSERYIFHSLFLVLLGATGALMSMDPRYFPVNAKAWVFAVAPYAFTTIMGLMLKEHQYINMRDRYIETELRPRLQEIAAPPGGFSWIGWEEFEHKQMGRQPGLPHSGERYLVFLILDALDYALGTLLVVTSSVAYLLIRTSIQVSRQLGDIIAIGGFAVFVLMLSLMAWLRTVEQSWYPHRFRRGS